MELLKGAMVSSGIKELVQAQLSGLNGRIPKLVIVRVGEHPDELSYERNAVKKISSFGMEAEVRTFPASMDNEPFQREFALINSDSSVTGILVLLPLPPQIDSRAVRLAIDPEKDVDGISPVNQAMVYSGDEDGFAPCTPEAVIQTLKAYEIPIAGKRVTLVGRSLVVGKPLMMLLLKENATVTVCHTKTSALADECRRADILIAAAGRAKMIDASFVGPGAVVVDVGINTDAGGNICGDVDMDAIEHTASMATPVPGGIGTVTTAVLGLHLLRAAQKAEKHSSDP